MKKLVYTAFLVTLFACNNEVKRFERLSSTTTGITFNNQIIEDDSFNILNNEYMYNGGGVGVGDLNNDGLQDLVFSGNKVKSRIYLNNGNFQFEDITDRFPDLDSTKWYSGVVLADINGDNFLDVYLTSTLNDDSLKRKNKCWINEGLDQNGIPTFREASEELGIADMGYSMHASFFDYDLDGDLDLYVLNNIVNEQIPTNYRPKITDGTAINNDKFYRNDGEAGFTEISKEAGITYEGFGLGLAVGDVNKDNYPDLYISNDYISNDLLYINQKDGTFRNESEDYLSYHSKFSMGNDMADYNNDGNLDIITLDMLPEDYYRKKQTINGNSYIFYVNDDRYGYQHQYVRNMVHTHNGFLGEEMIPFSEVGQLLGVHETEWSWSPLLADFDNDGDKDLFITNGFPKDLTDKDFTNYKAQMQGYLATDRQIIERIPVVKVSNYVYENQGDYSFDDKTAEWGMNIPSFSNGAAFADLDNDGDLDYVVNNINDPAFVYRNNTGNTGNYLRIKLVGSGKNTRAIGAKIEIKSGGKLQYHEQFLNRGYLSTIEPIAHFGLGNSEKVVSVTVTWPSGKKTQISDVEVNQTLTLSESEAVENEDSLTQGVTAIFDRLPEAIDFTHTEEEYIDFFQYQHIVPHKFSQIGPCMAQGDLNNDGLNDLIIGGTQQSPTTVLLREGNAFVSQSFPGLTEKKECQEADLVITDLEGDGDNDIVSLAGGYINDDESTYRHKVYINQGGQFEEKDIPMPPFSASVVIAFDYDKDGDEDIFAGSRVKKNFYPYAHPSYILTNDQGNLAPSESLAFDLGMVTDAQVTDFNGDGWLDIIIAREWSSITILVNKDGMAFERITSDALGQYTGFWSSVAAGDLDGDGDDDYIVGNLGENHRFNISEFYPMRLYAIDLDNNGTLDPLISSYWQDREGIMKEFPIHFFDELVAQSPYFRKQFQSYTAFSQATMGETIDISNVESELIFSVNTTSSYILWNEEGSFSWQKLPVDLQVAPIQEMLIKDFNGDQIVDVMVTGNDYTYDVSTGYYDANKGLIMIGKGDRKFDIMKPSESGLLVNGQVETLLYLDGENPLVVAGINRGPVTVFEHKSK